MNPSEAVRAFLTEYQIQNTAVLCALSGGADSVCLLSCLLEWQKSYHLRISAIHIQHQLRGAESQRDEQFCRQLCEKMQVQLSVVPVNVRAYAEEHHLSEETAARECRYQAFSDFSDGLIATAHTASDNLETVLFRLARGTGLKGLCGIPPKRGQYLRPLLQTTRKEIETYLHKKQLAFVTDSTNLQDNYSRNFIRHQVVPLLEQVHSGVQQSAVRMTELLRTEENYLELSAQNAYQAHLQPDGSLKDLHLLHKAMQRRCIAIFLESHQVKSDFYTVSGIEALLDSGGHRELVRGKLTARVSQHRLFLEQTISQIPEKKLIIGENQIFPEYFVRAELISRKNSQEFEKVHKKFANSALDYDIIKMSAILHSRKNGMYLKTTDRNYTVSVKKWLQTQPVSLRNRLHCLSDAQGLVWVQNLGAAERVSVTESTKTMLILQVHQTDTRTT